MSDLVNFEAALGRALHHPGHFLPAGRQGTRYTATAIHRDEATRKNHEEMGFFDGWRTVLDQLAEHVKTI
ncbi:SRPBCC domain-containing protein [Mesorhizobium sp. PAMC28654]|uniref:SRPBCC domain-containing protein n=1 Tax=Mesorhizobium sp. PAMC28654 TaxID=2880934 RepID=UPI001D0AF8E5|nr:SRPBCC domain-containing protein [Mesorhizobium sp. PAMC28654]UDL91781.1 SRPBCC domain-containing protein [Mesorhizobium sp. PAMC28654]